jgi:DNA-binding response OmpR family regulator
MKKRILIVDDEENVAKLVAAILRCTTKYDIEMTTNPYEAYALAKNSHFDLLISDVHMPGLDGSMLYLCLGTNLETFARLPNPPKLLLMSGALSEDALAAKRTFFGGSCYLQKPFAPSVLVAQVEAILEESPAVQNVASA